LACVFFFTLLPKRHAYSEKGSVQIHALSVALHLQKDLLILEE